MTIGEAISKLRGQMGMTQREFAEALGVTITSVSRFENDRAPGSKVLAKLADLAESNGLEELNSIFRGTRQTILDSRAGKQLQKLPSVGAARRIPLDNLNRWAAIPKIVAEHLMEARGAYNALIPPRHQLQPADQYKLYKTNHDIFALKGLLDELTRSIEPYINPLKEADSGKEAR